MEDIGSGKVIEYTVPYDGGATYRIAMSRMWKRSVGIFELWARISIAMIIVAQISALTAVKVFPEWSVFTVLMTSALFGFIGGTALTIYVTQSALASYKAGDETELWTCRMTDDAWSYQRKNGYTVSVPWEIMKVQFEHPLGFYVQFGESHKEGVFMIRKHLADLDLEAEFLKRLGNTSPS